MYDLDLKNKVILITGGSDGLGYASAELLSSEGAHVVICGRRGDYLNEKAKIISEKTIKKYENPVPLSDHKFQLRSYSKQKNKPKVISESTDVASLFSKLL